MQNRIVEVNTNGVYLNLSRGFLVVSLADEKIGQIAIEDIGALIIRGHGSAFSVNVCARLAEANVPVVLCGSNQAPASVIWPVAGHFAQGLNMQAQANANKPLLKRLWAQLIAGKVSMQARVLESFLLPGDDLHAMAKRVKSGDPENIEAQAARRYWQRLMGNEFRRDRGADGVNAALNYGYIVVRAAVARSILAAGLHPSLSLHHQSRGDALRLADDLMEPFRPWVDYKVRKQKDIEKSKDLHLDSHLKAQLVSVLQMDLVGPIGASPMQVCMDRMAQSLAQVFKGELKTMEIPGAPLPLLSAG